MIINSVELDRNNAREATKNNRLENKRVCLLSFLYADSLSFTFSMFFRVCTLFLYLLLANKESTTAINCIAYASLMNKRSYPVVAIGEKIYKHTTTKTKALAIKLTNHMVFKLSKYCFIAVFLFLLSAKL